MKIYAYKGKDNLCGERIRLARAKNRITQSDLAARMQVAGVAIERDSISRIERGTRIKGTAGKELNMENEMSKADLIAMLVSIREVARTNGETHTVEHIEKILEEVRK